MIALSLTFARSSRPLGQLPMWPSTSSKPYKTGLTFSVSALNESGPGLAIGLVARSVYTERKWSFGAALVGLPTVPARKLWQRLSGPLKKAIPWSLSPAMIWL